jgi:hypothetical protein
MLLSPTGDTMPFHALRSIASSSFVGAVAVFATASCGSAGGEEDAAQGDESALVGRTTAEICGAVEPKWGARWDGADATGAKQTHATDAFACANRLYWATRFNRVGVHQKFYLHKAICESNPASHFAMQDDQREFYCSLSLHFRMCNTQGLYALKSIPDGEARRARERAVFSVCLRESGELAHFRTALRMNGAPDAVVTDTVERLYDQYKVRPGVRIAPASVNPDRARHALLEGIVRAGFYGITVPIELLESGFADAFLTLDEAEHQSQLKLISEYRKALTNAGGRNLLDVSDLPVR